MKKRILMVVFFTQLLIIIFSIYWTVHFSVENKTLKNETALAFLVTDKFRADSAQYARYLASNRELLSKATGVRRVIFLGDSITDGWRLDDFFPNFPLKTINRGIDGQKTSQMVARFYHDVIKLKPEAVIILGGTNDARLRGSHPSLQLPEDTVANLVQDNLKTMVQMAHCAQIPRVFLCTIPPLGWDERDIHRAEPNPEKAKAWLERLKRRESVTDRISKWIRLYCAEGNCTVIDYRKAFTELGDHEKYFFDGVHPSRSGYEVMTKLVIRAVCRGGEDQCR